MRNLGNFWTSNTVSAVGSQVSLLGLPLIALTSLNAAGWQLGLLGALQFAPNLLLSLHLGRIVDRWPLRASLIWVNLACGLTVAVITVLNWLGALDFGSLCLLAFVLGSLRLYVEIGNNSYGPVIFEPSELVRANSRINTGSSIAETAGPGMAGLLIQLLRAPNALLVDSFSFLVAAFYLRRTAPLPTARGVSSTRSRGGLREGFQILFANQRLKILAVTSGCFNLCSRAIIVALPVFVVRELELSAGTLGLCLAVGGSGGILGAALAGYLVDRLSVTSAISLGILTASAGMALVPCGPGRVAGAVVAGVSLFVVWLGLSLYNVHVIAFRQAAAPPAAIGRVTASYRLISHGCTPVGAIASGTAIGVIGARATMAVAGLVAVSSALVAVRRFRSAPAPQLSVPSAH